MKYPATIRLRPKMLPDRPRRAVGHYIELHYHNKMITDLGLYPTKDAAKRFIEAVQTAIVKIDP